MPAFSPPTFSFSDDAVWLEDLIPRPHGVAMPTTMVDTLLFWPVRSRPSPGWPCRCRCPTPPGRRAATVDREVERAQRRVRQAVERGHEALVDDLRARVDVDPHAFARERDVQLGQRLDLRWSWGRCGSRARSTPAPTAAVQDRDRLRRADDRLRRAALLAAASSGSQSPLALSGSARARAAAAVTLRCWRRRAAARGARQPGVLVVGGLPMPVSASDNCGAKPSAAQSAAWNREATATCVPAVEPIVPAICDGAQLVGLNMNPAGRSSR